VTDAAASIGRFVVVAAAASLFTFFAGHGSATDEHVALSVEFAGLVLVALPVLTQRRRYLRTSAVTALLGVTGAALMVIATWIGNSAIFIAGASLAVVSLLQLCRLRIRRRMGV
jgi:hypothetical protein